MKKYVEEIVISTIVAALCTFISYVLGMEQSWQTASQTFIVAFLTALVLGLFRKNKNKDKKQL